MRWQSAWLPAFSAALLLAGCGGGGVQNERAAAPPPRLPHALAQELAQRADAVAARLARGDACAAKAQAATLQRAAIASVARIPAALREELVGGVNDLVARLPHCVPPPPQTQPPPPPAQSPPQREDEDERGHRGKDHGKGKGKKR